MLDKRTTISTCKQSHAITVQASDPPLCFKAKFQLWDAGSPTDHLDDYFLTITLKFKSILFGWSM